MSERLMEEIRAWLLAAKTMDVHTARLNDATQEQRDIEYLLDENAALLNRTEEK